MAPTQVLSLFQPWVCAAAIAVRSEIGSKAIMEK
jgi:hypothetical protein